MSKEEIIERLDSLDEEILDGRMNNYSIHYNLVKLQKEIKESLNYKIAE